MGVKRGTGFEGDTKLQRHRAQPLELGTDDGSFGGERCKLALHLLVEVRIVGIHPQGLLEPKPPTVLC